MMGKLKTGDFIIFAAVIILAVILFFCFFIGGEEGGCLVVSQGESVERYSLKKDIEFTLDSKGYHLCVVIEDGSAYIKNADCPDNTCVHSGRISKRGQAVACVPAGVVLRIEGEEADHDFVAG